MTFLRSPKKELLQPKIYSTKQGNKDLMFYERWRTTLTYGVAAHGVVSFSGLVDVIHAWGDGPLPAHTSGGPHVSVLAAAAPDAQCTLFPSQVSPSKPFVSSRSGLTLLIFVCEIYYLLPINFDPVTEAKVASDPCESSPFCHRVIFNPEILKSADKHTLL